MAHKNNQRIYLSPPHMGGDEQAFIQSAFESNWIAPLGPNVDAFEHEAALVSGRKGGAALSSGTAALHCALRLCGVQRGDFVLCSSLTFAGSSNPILYQGAIPVFIDSSRDDWNMCPILLEQAIQDLKRQGIRCKAAIVVDLYGQSADYAKLVPILERENIVLIEDAAEALGASYQGRPCGSFGKMAVLSFNGNKIITTSGGGMLVSDDAELLKEARFLATQARDDAPHYEHSQLGYNYRMSNIVAGIGRGQLHVLKDRIERKRQLFQQYDEACQRWPGINMMPISPHGSPNYWLSVLTIDRTCPASADSIRQALELENIESRPVWKPMHQQPMFTLKTTSDPELPRLEPSDVPPFPAVVCGGSVSDDLFERGLCLPSGTAMGDDVVQRICDTIDRALLASVREPFHVEKVK